MGVIILLIVIAVLLFRVCIAAVLSVGSARHDQSGAAARLRRVEHPDGVSESPRSVPVVDRSATVSRQVMTLGLPANECMTKDNRSVRVEAVVYFRVRDAGPAADDLRAQHSAVSRLAQASLRSVIGSVDLDDLSSKHKKRRAERTEVIDAPSEQPWRGTHDKPAHTTPQDPTGPQDAPLPGPRDAAGLPQDAACAPQEAAHAVLLIEQVEQSVGPLSALAQENLELLGDMAADAFGLDQRSSESRSSTSSTEKEVVLGRVSTIAATVSRGATKTFRDVTSGRRTALVAPDRVTPSQGPGTDHTRQRTATVEMTILDSVPRPIAGPAYFGGRDDAVYLCGWDDAIDSLRRGHEEHGPSWGSAAYMTGWQDALRAIARARG